MLPQKKDRHQNRMVVHFTGLTQQYNKPNLCPLTEIACFAMFEENSLLKTT